MRFQHARRAEGHVGQATSPPPGSISIPAGRPSLPSSPREGIEYIDEDQVFLLGLDAVADIASVREHAYCSINGLGERVPLQIIEGKERERILAEQKGEAKDFFLVLTKRARLGLLAVKDKRLDEAPAGRRGALRPQTRRRQRGEYRLGRGYPRAKRHRHQR